MKQSEHYPQILGLVHKIARLVNPQHLPTLREGGLTQSQFLVLDTLLGVKDGVRPSALAVLCGLSATELSRVIPSLVTQGHLDRLDDPSDSRARLIRSSPSGKRAVRRAHSAATAELGLVWDDFTHDEWHRFVDFLERFERSLRRARSLAAARKSKAQERKLP